MVTGRISTMATTVMATGTHGSTSRVAGAQQQPADRGADDERAHLDRDEQVGGRASPLAGDPGHRGHHRGIGGRGDRDGQRAADHRDPRVLGDHGERGRGEQHAAGQQRRPHDQVAAHRVGQPCGQPGDRDVGQHPRAAGEPEQPRVVGVRGDQDQQQRPGERDGERTDGVGDDGATGGPVEARHLIDPAGRSAAERTR